MVISSIFEKPIDRPIEGVIKADDESGLRVEFEEYVLTNEVAKRLANFLYAYNNYDGANGVWISGFFGSGKSHLLKMLAYVLENRPIDGAMALEFFAPKCAGDDILLADLRRAVAIPSRSILFNIDQKADVISKKEIDAVLAVFVKVFNEMRGYYGKQGHIAQFERDLDGRNLYETFKQAYHRISGLAWETGREQALLEGPNIAKAYAEVTGADPESVRGILDKYRDEYKMSIEDFAAQVDDYITTQGPNFRLNFFVDEVGQYVADSVKLMTNLQTIAESLATRCRGRAWLVVTAQEEISTVVGAMGKQQGTDFSKIQDRFKIRLKLTSTDVAEVIRRRLLAKKADSIEALSDIHNAQQNSFQTLFGFGDGTKTYRNFRDRDDFVHSYPFIPYQFDLFQAAIMGLSAHDAFEGRHSSVGERSMLGVFQQVAMAIGKEQVGRLATFDKMFEGIRAALKSQIQQSILSAERNLDDDFAVRLLKALFLVKYVKEFKATPRNLTVLMLDSFDTDLPALRRRVEQALDVLEQQIYVLRRGEEYEYLTDEEKDVEREIANTQVDLVDVQNELSTVVFDRIVKDRKIRFPGNDQDFTYARKLDDRLDGRDYELAIHVISPFHEHSGDVTILRAQAMGRDELLVILPPDPRLQRDLMLYKRTEKYARQNTTVAQKESVKQILSNKLQQNNERMDAIRRQTESLLAQATLIVGGSDVDTGTGDARSRLVKGFEQLVMRTYPHLSMLRGVKYTEAGIESFLKPETTLLGDAEGTFSEPEREMLAFIQSNKTAGQRSTMQALVNRFERKPYGWYLAAIQCTLAKLIARGKVEARRDSNVLENAELAQALRNTHGFANLLLEPQIEFTPGQIRQLKDFYSAFFDGPPHANEAKALGQETAAALQKLNQELALLRQRAETYPFAADVDRVAAAVGAIAHKPYAFYLGELPPLADGLLDLKEQVLDPVREFLSGPQRVIYDSARELLRSQEANFAHAGGDEAQQLGAMLADPACYQGRTMQGVKALADTLREKSQALVMAEREAALAEIDAAWGQLMNDSRYTALSSDRQDMLARPFSAAKEAIGRHVLVDAIRGARYTFRDHTLPAIRDDLREWSRPPMHDGDDGDEKTIVEPAYISATALPVDYYKQSIDDETDARRYLEALNRAIAQELQNGRRIRL